MNPHDCHTHTHTVHGRIRAGHPVTITDPRLIHVNQVLHSVFDKVVLCQDDGMLKSFFDEMNQTDAQRLMFIWKTTELENIFEDEFTETTTHTVSLHDIVCDPDSNTKTMHIRALSDWMKILMFKMIPT